MTILATRLSPDGLTLSLELRLDAAGAERLREALTEDRLAGVRFVQLDLARVSYLSSGRASPGSSRLPETSWTCWRRG